MKQRHFAAILSAALLPAAALAQGPRILDFGTDEYVGPNGRLSSIAVDTLDQPHIVCDGGSMAYFYDRVGAAWQSSALDVGTLGYRQFYNPHLEIDRNNRGWCSGVLVAGLGFICREQLSTAPIGPWFREYLIEPVWDCGNLSIDPNAPDFVVGSSARGKWTRFIYDASQPAHIRPFDDGRLYAYNGGEKNNFWISKAGNVQHPARGNQAVWHGITDTSYQNSYREDLGYGFTGWADWNTYTAMWDDGGYPGLTSDRVQPQVAYMAHGFINQGGVLINIWQGNNDGSGQLLRPSTALLSVGPGWSGLRRYAVQMAGAKDGGAFICWTYNPGDGERVMLRWIGADGTLGETYEVARGGLADICSDSLGNLHLVYNNGAIWYRKLSISGSQQVSTWAGDYNGDAMAEIVVFRSSGGRWYFLNSNGSEQNTSWGLPGDMPCPADFDGDQRLDMCVFRPSTGGWYVWCSTAGFTSRSWGVSGDLPVPADYDGDRKADFAVYRPESNKWYIARSTGGEVETAFGIEDDVPVPADYDGDGIADVAVWRPGNGTWYYFGSQVGSTSSQWGLEEDIPAPADYDGDGRVDICVYRPAAGTWYYWGSTIGYREVQWGAPSDVPVPGLYDSDRRADIAIYRPTDGTWYILRSTDNRLKGRPGIPWGATTDTPIPARYNQDARTDIAVFRSSTGRWYIRNISTFDWGGPGDVAVPADYDGDGTNDTGVFRPSNGTWYLWRSTRGYLARAWGAPGDRPLPRDFDNDGRADIAVWRPSNGTWYILRGNGTTQITAWGASGDVPMPADYDRDDRVDIGIYRPSIGTWFAWGSASGQVTQSWGAPTDTPVHKDMDGDGKSDLAVFRPGNGTWYIIGSQRGAYSAQWGTSGDAPAPADYDGDGTNDFAVTRAAGGTTWWIRSSRTRETLERPGPVAWGSTEDIPLGAKRK